MGACGGVEGHLQVCYDIIARDTGGFTVRFYVNSVAWGFNDPQTLNWSGSNGVSGSANYTASSPDGTSREMYHADIGFPAPPGGCVSFQANVTGNIFGGNANVSGTDCAAAAPPSPPVVGVRSITSTSANPYSVSPGAENGATTDTLNYRIHRASDNAHMGDLQAGYEGPTFTNLSPGVAYNAYAQAHNAAGWGSFSGPAAFTTAAAVPGAPNASVDTITDTSVHAFVTTAPPNNGSAITTYTYRLYRGTTVVVTVNGPQSGVTFSGLSKATAYSVKATATNSVGTSAEGTAASFTTLPSIPGAPTITGITSITPTSAVVSWSPPTDTGGQTITAYDVSYSSDDFATETIQSTGTLTGLTPGTVYKVRVRAKNASGNGPYSAISSFTTQTGMKVYNGTAFVDAPVYAYTGSAWVACEVRIYNGSAWVPTG